MTDFNIYNGTPVSPYINCASLPAAAARQGNQLDFGATRAPNYNARVICNGFVSAPTAGGTVDLYMAWSDMSVPVVSGFPGGVSGVDNNYTGWGTLANALPQLDFIGSLVAANVTGVQLQDAGILLPRLRYGSPVIVNNTSVALASMTGVVSIILTPIVDTA